MSGSPGIICRIRNLFRDSRIVWGRHGQPIALRGTVYDYSPDEYAEIVRVFERALHPTTESPE